MSNLDFIRSERGRKLIDAFAKLRQTRVEWVEQNPRQMYGYAMQLCNRCGAPYRYEAVKCDYCGVIVKTEGAIEKTAPPNVNILPPDNWIVLIITRVMAEAAWREHAERVKGK